MCAGKPAPPGAEARGHRSAGRRHRAHEINTPTQFVTDNLSFLRDSWKSANDLLEQYRSAIRDGAGKLPPAVAAALEQAERNCDLDFIASEYARAINQVILNLIVNAAHAIKETVKEGEKGSITVRTQARGDFVEEIRFWLRKGTDSANE